MIANRRTIRIALFASLALALVLVPVALAAKGGGSGGSKPPTGGGGGTSSITGPVLVTDLNGNGAANWDDTVTFNVSTTATTQPYVDLKCFQGSALVLHSSAGFFAEALNSGYDFTLMSGAWPGGAATCTATLGMYGGSKGSWQQLATMSFTVGA